MFTLRQLLTFRYIGKIIIFLCIVPPSLWSISPIQDYFWLYEYDRGESFSQKPSGYRYGWNTENSGSTYERNSDLAPDERYDRGIIMGDKQWEMDVEPGVYRVLIVAGDADVTDAIYKINVEDILVVDGVPTTAFPWVTGYKDVEVTDGKLTISSAAGAQNNRLAYLHVYSQEGIEYEEPQYVSIPAKINLGGNNMLGFAKDRDWTSNAPHGCFSDSENFFHRFTTTFDQDLVGTELDEIFKTYRTPSEKTGSFTYRMRISEPGTYFVTLLIAEFSEGLKSRRRKGELLINGKVVKTLDYSDDIGYGNARFFEYEVGIEDEFIDVTVQGVGGVSDNRATLSGIIVGTEPFTENVSNRILQTSSKKYHQISISHNILHWNGLQMKDRIEVFSLSGKKIAVHEVSKSKGTIKLQGIAPSVVTTRLVRNGKIKNINRFAIFNLAQ